MIFSLVHEAFREAALSHAAQAAWLDCKIISQPVSTGLLYRRLNAKSGRALKRPLVVLSYAHHAACAAWLEAAYGGKPDESG
ncbi:MAG: hypothetical protein ACR2MG_01060 [Pyrinomonadaceae bacterium]